LELGTFGGLLKGNGGLKGAPLAWIGLDELEEKDLSLVELAREMYKS